jgi:diadenosine tetraphosphatase ApaH/serine/threonine PP2A family protein phosphatase
MIVRTILAADIHGCLEEFKELLKILSYNPGSDRLILLGDLIDRGPESLGVVRMARSLKLESVMGNHDEKLLKWLKNEKRDNNHYYSSFNEEDINYISRMPYYIKLNDNTVAVHAGLRTAIPLEKQTNEDMSHMRYISKDGKFVSLNSVRKLGKEAAGAYFWTERYYLPYNVVYGHHVHSNDYPLIEEVTPGVFCYGLDTGCVFGGKLTAMILETKEIIQVPAKKIYYQSNDKNFNQKIGKFK